MNQDEFQRMERLSDRELFDFVTETDGSQHKWVAIHLLELRRNRELTRAAKSSAKAAWIAAFIAGISAIIAVLAYLHATKPTIQTKVTSYSKVETIFHLA